MTDPVPEPKDCTARMPQKLLWRRVVFALLVLATLSAMLGLMAYTLGEGGLDWADWIILVAFAATLPWQAIGLWNAVIGLWLMRVARDPLALAAPAALLGNDEPPITTRTAILVCIRNEDPLRLERNLEAMMQGLIGRKVENRLQVFMLSDTNRPAIAGAEEQVAARLAARFGSRLAVTYRRRESNPGFKAGNIRDFCERWGGAFDFAVVLDADSFMGPHAILRLIRIMQAGPQLGIVQSLVVGQPTISPFARIFQFGMRLGMRSYTMGGAWWQGDCGPYWGHNAIIRLAPFLDHCALPILPGSGPFSGHVLSHDQVEAVLMRRAGYEVRVVPIEDGSWEENPPTLLEFIRRDLRWCQGNLQYLRLLGMAGLRPISRWQLVLAILMFIGSPAWMLIVAVATFRGLVIDSAGPVFREETGLLLFCLCMAMTFAPKIASVLDVLATRRGVASFGGLPRFLAGVAVETLFFSMLAPIMAVAHTVFIGGLALGRQIGWTVAVREDHLVPFGAAFARLWVQMLCGALLLLWFATMAPGAIWYGLPFFAPLLLAIPFAMLSARSPLGAAMAGVGLCAIPEEVAPPDELVRLDLPAIVAGGRAPLAGAAAD